MQTIYLRSLYSVYMYAEQYMPFFSDAAWPYRSISPTLAHPRTHSHTGVLFHFKVKLVHINHHPNEMPTRRQVLFSACRIV